MYTKQFPPAFMNTWVFVGFANKLKPAKLRTLQIMDRELILWKTLSGTISLIDAYCPHLGAHLGNGKIRGEALECNFHKRRFNSDGQCLGSGKSADSYPITLIKNMIFAWFGTHTPTWEMPDLLAGFYPYEDESKWRLFGIRQFNYNFHPKDVLDNTVDPSHFKTFHNQCNTYYPVEVLDVTDFSFFSKATFSGHPKLSKRGHPYKLELVTQSYGPASLVVNSTAEFLNRKYFFKFIFLGTPQKNKKTLYTLAVAIKESPKSELSLIKRMLNYFFTRYAFRMQVKEFIVESEKVWETKTHLQNPDYSSKEEAMKQFHKWYSQFSEVKATEDFTITT